MPPILQLVATAVAGVALLFVIIGVAIPYWLYYEANGLEVYMGLWKTCAKITVTGASTLGTQEGCSTSGLDLLIDVLKKQDKDFFTPTRGLEMFGLLVLTGAIAVSVVHILLLKDNDLLYLVAGGVAMIAGVFMLIGTIVFGAMRKDAKVKAAFDQYDLHAGFALCIVAALLSKGASALFIVAKLQSAKN